MADRVSGLAFSATRKLEVCRPGSALPAAMGMLLVERLRNAGMTFKILEEGQAAA